MSAAGKAPAFGPQAPEQPAGRERLRRQYLSTAVITRLVLAVIVAILVGLLTRTNLPWKRVWESATLGLFITFIREFVDSVRLFNPGNEVVSTVMYSYCSNGSLPQVAGISVLLSLAVVALMILMARLFKIRISF